MNKILSIILLAISFNLQANNPKIDYAAHFKNYDGCFMLYDVKRDKIVSEYNPNNRCNEALPPNSTFKIPLSLMAFNDGLIDQQTVFKWDGKKGELARWDQDQTPQSWMSNSVVWVSQDLSQKLGEKRIAHFLADFNYGNQDFSGDPGLNNGITHAWLASSLKISANEQLQFLKAMLKNTLTLNENAIKNTKQNIYLGKLNNGADYYGKTGSGRHGRNERLANPSPLRDGWFIGFIEQGEEQYIFVSNLTDKVAPLPTDKGYGSQILKPITLTVLNEYFSS